jgi:DNA uptake protein ComE-like DNA-binding protein
MMVSVVSKTLFGLGFAAALLVAGSALAQTPQVATDAKAGMTAKTKTAVPLDINTASVAELQALKGVGDKRAADIVKGRPYKGKDDLVQKKILPQSVYNGIKDQIIAKQK